MAAANKEGVYRSQACDSRCEILDISVLSFRVLYVFSGMKQKQIPLLSPEAKKCKWPGLRGRCSIDHAREFFTSDAVLYYFILRLSSACR